MRVHLMISKYDCTKINTEVFYDKQKGHLISQPTEQ